MILTLYIQVILHYFLPVNNSHQFLDHLLRPVGRVANLGLGSRLVDVISNTSKVCTSERRIVEQSIARSFDQKLAGVKFPISHQLMEASGTQPTPDIPVIGIWLDVMAVLRRLTRPYQLRYGLAPNVTLTTGVTFWPD